MVSKAQQDSFTFVCQTHLPVCGSSVFLTKLKQRLSSSVTNTFRLVGTGWKRHYGAKLCVRKGCDNNYELTWNSPTVIFQENKCCAQHSSSAANISGLLSKLYLLSVPQVTPFRFHRMNWGKDSSIRHYMQKSFWLAQSQAALRPLLKFYLHCMVLAKLPYKHFESPAISQCFILFQGTTRIAVSLLTPGSDASNSNSLINREEK